MPGFNGLEAIRRMRARQVTAKVTILTMHADPALVSETLYVGAQGYVLKQNAANELLVAVRRVSCGLTYITFPPSDTTQDPVKGCESVRRRALIAGTPAML